MRPDSPTPGDAPHPLQPLPRRRVSLGLASLVLAHCASTAGRPASDTGAAGPREQPRELRILCLHGYHGSARILRSQMAPLAEGIQLFAELVFVDAPSLAAGDFGWWHAVDAERDPASGDPGTSGPHRHYKGWARTRAAIIAEFERQGPFDGLLGFSQGAALAGLLVGLRAPDGKPTAERPLRFDFAIVVSGFPSNDPELSRLYEGRDSYDLPSLHVLGQSDRIVPIDASRALAARFTHPVLVEHDGGHVVPGTAGVVDRVREFLAERLH